MCLGCGSATSTDDMSTTSNPDLSMTQGTPDLSMTQAGDDLSMTTSDLTAPANSITFHWNLISANIMGGSNNGFQVACNEAVAVSCGDPNAPTRMATAVTQLQFSLQNVAGGTTTMATVSCPSGDMSGNATIMLPDATGPYNLTGTAVGETYPNGFRSSSNVTPFGPNDNVSINVFVCGCDSTGNC
jgi:hypothetical protein